MPDSVTDIVHRITYDVNKAPIDDVNKAFDTQFTELKALNAEQAKLNDLLAKQGNSATVVDQLNSKLAVNKQRIDDITVSVGKQFAANEKLQGSVAKVTRQYNGLGMAFSQLIREAPAFAFSAQTGLLAISNNIPILLDQLKVAQAQGKTTKEIFSALGSSLFGLTGIITLAVSALTIFGGELFKTSKAAQEAEESYVNFINSLRSNVVQSQLNIDKQIRDINILLSLVEKGGTGAALAIEELQGKYPRLFKEGKLSQDELNKGITKLREQIPKLEEVKRLDQEISDNEKYRLDKLEPAKKKAQDEYTKAIADYDKLRNEGLATQGKQDELDRLAIIKQTKLLALNTAQADISNIKTRNQINENNAIRLASESIDIYINKLTKAEKEKDKYFRPRTVGKKEYIEDPFKVNTDIKITDFQAPATAPRFYDARATLAQYNEELARSRKREAQRLESIEKLKQSFIDLGISVAQAMDSIYEAQLSKLDYSINLQTRRIQEAEKLAERGNADAYDQEVKRLNDLEQERERVAQRQAAVNALLQASTAALALVKAIEGVITAATTTAEEGGGIIGFVASLAAGAAAIAGLYASIQSLSSGGFSEGGFTGEGGKYEAAGVVHKGEYVFTKEKTAQYRPFFEAVHEGKINPLALYQSDVSNSYLNDKGIRQDLQDIKEAVETNKVNVKQVMDAYGLTQVVEQQQRKEARLWS